MCTFASIVNKKMLAVYQKEIRQFFSSLIGYIAIIVFLVALGAIVWVNPDNNILDFGYATLDYFFWLTPVVFIFLIPAITMRMFSEEIYTGSIELLATKPISELAIVSGKYFAALTLVALALLPTLTYFYTIYNLALPIGNVDVGGIIGSYFGLIFLGAVFVAIGLFSSSLFSNQIVSFVIGVLLCGAVYVGFESLANFTRFIGTSDYMIQQLGLYAHYNAMSKGIIDSRDVIYFISLIILFIFLTRTALAARKW